MMVSRLFVDSRVEMRRIARFIGAGGRPATTKSLIVRQIKQVKSTRTYSLLYREHLGTSNFALRVDKSHT